jgi:hypothetical protein
VPQVGDDHDGLAACPQVGGDLPEPQVGFPVEPLIGLLQQHIGSGNRASRAEAAVGNAAVRVEVIETAVVQSVCPGDAGRFTAGFNPYRAAQGSGAGDCSPAARRGNRRASCWPVAVTFSVVQPKLGHTGQALASLRESLALFRQISYSTGQITALRHLGDTLRAAGHRQQAAAWQEALDISQTLDASRNDKLTTRLGAPRQGCADR